MIVGVLKIEIYMEYNRSLKDKRKLVKGLIQRIKSKFLNVSVSEVAFLDSWKKSTLGITLVSNEVPFVNSVLNRILKYIENTGLYQIVMSEIEVIHC